jgi:hypothetical protein
MLVLEVHTKLPNQHTIAGYELVLEYYGPFSNNQEAMKFFEKNVAAGKCGKHHSRIIHVQAPE